MLLLFCTLYSHTFCYLCCALSSTIFFNRSKSAARILLFFIFAQFCRHSFFVLTHTQKMHMHLHAQAIFSLSCILLYFCFISCFALHTQHKTCYCSFDALLSAVQCMCAFQPLSFQYRTTMMHFSLLKHTHTQHSCTFFLVFFLPTSEAALLLVLVLPARPLSLFSRYSCWCSVILVCFFFLLIVVVVVCLR